MSIYQKIANIQDKVQNITKDGKNPHFSNTYATYEQVMEILRPYLRVENLMVCHSFAQPLFEGQIAVTTHVVETLPEFDKDQKNGIMSTTLYIPMTKNDPQMAGSAITYAKRYSVLAMFGLGTEDDDGNGVIKAPVSSPKPTTVTKEVEDEGLSADCPIHGDKLIERISKKTGMPYWSHFMPDGSICFGNGAK
jgi:hypothetical protein